MNTTTTQHTTTTERITAEQITLSDLGTYLAALWVLQGNTKIPTNLGFHHSLSTAFKERQSRLQENFRVPFRLCPHQIHGDSPNITRMLNQLVFTRGLGHFTVLGDGYLHLDLDASVAREIVKIIPEKALEILKEIAKESFEKYRPPSTWVYESK